MASKGRERSPGMETPMKHLQLQGRRAVAENIAKAIATTVASPNTGHMNAASPKRSLKTASYPMHHRGTAMPHKRMQILLPNPRTNPLVQPMLWLSMTLREMGSGWLRRRI